jgi:hypothetical protein
VAFVVVYPIRRMMRARKRPAQTLEQGEPAKQ